MLQYVHALCRLQVHHLASFGGRNVADGVRYILKRLATNKVWSQFTLQGRSGKRAFGTTPLMNVITSKCTILLTLCVKFYLKLGYSSLVYKIANSVQVN